MHAIRIGHKDVAIVLLGAFSRWINRLNDEDIRKAQVQSQLKALRTFHVEFGHNSNKPLSPPRCWAQTGYQRGFGTLSARFDSLVHANFDYERGRQMGLGSSLSGGEGSKWDGRRKTGATN